MGWFNKKEQQNSRDLKNDIPELPKLPELPELPELPNTKKSFPAREPIHQLPSFPNNSLGQKFSQNTIKQAVVAPQRQQFPKQQYSQYPEGRKGERVFEADDFAPKQRRQMMPKPLKPVHQREFDFKHTREIQPIPEFEFDVEEFEQKPQQNMREYSPEPKQELDFEPKTTRKEPVFIRIDKFEESLKIFEKSKRELGEIERVLKDIESVKEDEQNELESWKKDVLKIKEQIDKVDNDIFSRLE